MRLVKYIIVALLFVGALSSCDTDEDEELNEPESTMILINDTNADISISYILSNDTDIEVVIPADEEYEVEGGVTEITIEDNTL